MALIDCKNCGHRISDKAKACPKCGIEVLAQSSEPEQLIHASQVNQAAQLTQQSQTTTQPQEPEQPIESVKQAQPVEQRQQSTQSAFESQDIGDEDEPRSNKGLIFGLVFGGIALIVVAVLCIPQLRFWESINKKDLLETAYNEGYNCGKQFGCMTRCDELFEMANSTYNSEGVVSKDDFQQQFTLGMEAGIKDSPYKAQAAIIENIAGTYSGNVGKSKIRMTLTCSNNIVNGTYSYTKINNTLYLSGQLVGSEILLEETTPKGNNSATWTLHVTEAGLQGSMYVNHTGKTHNVSLTRVE